MRWARSLPAWEVYWVCMGCGGVPARVSVREFYSQDEAYLCCSCALTLRNSINEVLTSMADCG